MTKYCKKYKDAKTVPDPYYGGEEGKRNAAQCAEVQHIAPDQLNC